MDNNNQLNLDSNRQIKTASGPSSNMSPKNANTTIIGNVGRGISGLS